MNFASIWAVFSYPVTYADV